MSEREFFIGHRTMYAKRLGKHTQKCSRCKNAGLHTEMMCQTGKRIANQICAMNENLKGAQ